MDFYVYLYLRPDVKGNYDYGDYLFEYEPFYVGKGKGSRMYYHVCDSKLKDTKTKKRAIIKSLKNKKMKPIYYKIKNLTEKEAFELEIKLIKKIGRFDLGLGPLCNLTNGGEGPSGNVLSEETKKKISHSLKNKPKTEDHKNKVSESLKNKPKTKDHKKNTSTGVKKYYENNNHSKSIKVMNVNTGEIFNSAQKAAKKINGNATHILSVCRGIRNQHKKIKWKFV